MLLEEIREELIAQHAALREEAAIARGVAERVLAGDGRACEELRVHLDGFARSLEQHNHREEELLGPVIKTIDAWGEVRASLMDERHKSEHRSIVEALREAAALDRRADSAARLIEVIDTVLGYIAYEDRELLHPDVLTDLPRIDTFLSG